MHLRDAANVFISILLAESEVLVEAETNVVPVKTIGKVLEVEQMLFQCTSNGGLETPVSVWD